MPALSRLNCSSLPSRYQEGLKKTKELQDLKEEEEERKRENPEEPEETELEEDEKDERRRLVHNSFNCTTSLGSTSQGQQWVWGPKE